MKNQYQEIADLKEQILKISQRIEKLESTDKAITKEVEDSEFESFYLAFENKYRGQEEEISQRLKYCRDFVLEQVPKKDSKIIDLGCGRGEWLHILSQNGYTNAIGIDSNSEMISRCQQKELTAQESDIFEYIQHLDTNSCAAISGFHIIEHFPFNKLITLFKETLRTLTPGGIAIFETPNPRNVFVGACSFHFDPTHIKPIPSELSSFLAQYLGFEVLGVRFANTHPDIPQNIIEKPQVPELWHNSFAIGLDYALLLKKPS